MRKRFLVFSLMSLLALSSMGTTSALVLQQTSETTAATQLLFPVPTGTYGVGKVSQLFTDSSRPELFTEDPADVRQLPVTFYYPSTTEKTPQSWLQGKVLQGLSQSSGLPQGLLSQLKSYAVDQVPVASGRFPLVILSHGLPSTPYISTTLAEELASQGFIVAAVSHPYSALFAVLGDQVVFLKEQGDLMPDPALTNPLEQIQDRERQYTEVQNVWTSDLRYLIKNLPAAPEIRDHVDARHVAVVGHSFGGVAALRVASEVQAAINLDGGLGGGALQDYLSSTPTLTLVSEGTPREMEALPADLEPVKSLLETMNIGNWLRIERSPGYAAYLEFKGANHNNFTDLAVLNKLIPPIGQNPAYAVGPADPLKTTRTLNQVVVHFLKAVFDGAPPNLNSLKLPDVEVVEHLPANQK